MNLFQAMRASGRYENDQDIKERIKEMKQEVLEGGDPEEILHEEGFEPDYIFDIL